jgi:hypothetical protein
MDTVAPLPASPLLRWKWLVLPALALESAGIHLMPAGDGAPLRRLAMVTAYSLLLAVAWKNRGRLSVRVIAIGLLLNCIAMGIGGGLMPVDASTLQAAGLGQLSQGISPGQPVPHSKDVLMQQSQTPLWPITDSIAVNNGPMHYSISPGDLIVLAGLLAGALELIVISRPPRPVVPTPLTH